MADPLSIAASIAGLISISVEAAKFLSPYVSAAKETPQVATHVFSEIQSTQVILQGLQSLTMDFATVKAQHAALIGVNQVVAILTDGVLLFSELQSELSSLPAKDETDERISLLGRLQWARKESSLNTLILRLQSFKSSMTLVLMILKSDSDRSAAEHQKELANNIEVLLQTNHALSHRLMNLEDILETQTILTKRKSLLSLPARDDQSQELQPGSPSTPWSPISTDTNIDLSKFDFEDDLESSRVYRRAQRETMDFSFRSSIARSRSWSVFSGFSLSDVSALSVIALPIHSSDITNAHHYNFGETTSKGVPQESNSTDVTATPQDVPLFRGEQPLLVECHDLKLKMLQLPGMGNYFYKVASPLDPYHHLWDVVRQSSPLIILLQALDPSIEAPHHGWNRTDKWRGRPIDPKIDIKITTKEKKRTILWFIQYCHTTLNIPISSLFTISDLMYGDCYGFFKVLPIISFILEKLKAQGTVEDFVPVFKPESRHNPSTIMDFVSDQQNFVHEINELVEIMPQLTSYSKLGGDESVIKILGLAKKLAAMHIALLIKMEKNLFLSAPEHRWTSVFEFYLENMDLETLLITKKMAVEEKIRSVLSSAHSMGDNRTKILSRCLAILPLIPNRTLTYIQLLGEIRPASSVQAEDKANAQLIIQKANDKVNEAVKLGKNQLVVKDLESRILDWEGLSPLNFGNLLLYNSVPVTFNSKKSTLRAYLFEEVLLLCAEVDKKPQQGRNFFNGGSSIKPTTKQQHAKLVLKGRFFVKDIVNTITSNENGSYFCEVRWRTDGRTKASWFIMEFTTEQEMSLWVSKIRENTRRAVFKADAELDAKENS